METKATTKRDTRRGGGRRPRQFTRPEYDQKILSIRRVTRVVKGGRRMTFAVSLAIGDRKGLIGLGTGKGLDTVIAINKAQKDAKKNMLKLKLTKEGSLPHEIKAKFGSAEVMLMPNHARGTIAGSAVREMLLLAGVKNVTSKIISGTKNKLNIARATMEGFKTIGERVVPNKKKDEKKTETKEEK